MATVMLPQSFEAMTPAWLTGVLAEGGHISGATVAAVTVEPIGQGVGLLCQLARLTLEYDGAAPGAPRTVIAKIPSPDPQTRELAQGVFHFYEREVSFYQHLVGDIALRPPAAYYTAWQEETRDFILLLEDLGDMRLGDQLAGCSSADLDVAIVALAKHHATWWNHPRLDDLTWMPNSSDPINKAGLALYPQAWPLFVEKLGHTLPAEVLVIGERLGAHMDAILDHFAATDRTVCHGDYRIDNFLFAAKKSDLPLRIVDWQITMKAVGTYDLGYLMSQSVAVDVRRAREQDLLRLYHRTLVENGVEGYSFEACQQDYRWTILFCFAYPVMAGGFVDLVNDRAVALATSMMERSATAILDWQTGELIA